MYPKRVHLNSKNYQKFKWGYLLIFNLIIAIIIIKVGATIFTKNQFNDLSKINSGTHNCIPFLNLLFWILMPIKEEIKYRLLLGKFKFKNLILSFSFILSDLIILYLYYNHGIYKFDCYSIIYLSLIFPSGIIIYFLCKRFTYKYMHSIHIFFNKIYSYIFYGSLLTCALWHVFYSGQTDNQHYIVIFVFHFVNAIFSSFVRVNKGILDSITYHFCFNIPFFILEVWAVAIYYM